MNNRDNVYARFLILKKGLLGQEAVSTVLLKACKSQGAFAKLNWPEKGIVPIALNTLKSKADEAVEDGGWRKLDEMRKAYLVVGQGKVFRKSNTRSRIAEWRSQLRIVESALEMERRYRIRLQVAYEALLGRVRVLATDDPDLAHFVNRHVEGFSFKRLSVVSTVDTKTND
ncbi:hypothetical protein [Chitinimonas naiadis]